MEAVDNKQEKVSSPGLPQADERLIKALKSIVQSSVKITEKFLLGRKKQMLQFDEKILFLFVKNYGENSIRSYIDYIQKELHKEGAALEDIKKRTQANLEHITNNIKFYDDMIKKIQVSNQIVKPKKLVAADGTEIKSDPLK